MEILKERIDPDDSVKISMTPHELLVCRNTMLAVMKHLHESDYSNRFQEECDRDPYRDGLYFLGHCDTLLAQQGHQDIIECEFAWYEASALYKAFNQASNSFPDQIDFMGIVGVPDRVILKKFYDEYERVYLKTDWS